MWGYGGVDSSVHLVSYRGQGVNANIGTGNFNGVNVVYGRVPPCKIKRFHRGQTPTLIPIRGARGNRTLDFQLSDDRIHPKAGCRSRHALPIESVVGVYTSVPVCFARVSQRRGPLGPKTFEIEGIGRVAAKLQHESDCKRNPGCRFRGFEPRVTSG